MGWTKAGPCGSGYLLLLPSSCQLSPEYWLNPKVEYLQRGKTRQSAADVGAHRLGQVEAYSTVREVLSEYSRPTKGGTIARAQRFLAVWVCNVRVNSKLSLGQMLQCQHEGLGA